jgi:hypothetical protein
MVLIAGAHIELPSPSTMYAGGALRVQTPGTKQPVES